MVISQIREQFLFPRAWYFVHNGKYKKLNTWTVRLRALFMHNYW